MRHTPTAHREAVAAEVRALMGRHRVSQTALADVLGTSQAAVSRRLTGDVPFDVDDLYAIAERFDIEVSRLLGPYTAWFTGVDPETRTEVERASASATQAA